MKYLKYFAGFLLLLGIIFLLAGVIKPTITYGNEITINKPVNETWEVMLDPSKTSQWLTGFKSAELISGEKDQLGAVSKMIIEDNGTEMEMIETITASKKYEHMGLEMDASILTSQLDMYFTEKDGKTIIKSETVAKGKTMFFRSLFAIFSGSMKSEDLKIMNNIKRVAEENTTNYFPAPVVETMEVQE